MNSDHQSLGSRMKDQRRAIYMTQTQLAQRLNVRQSTISMWETNRVSPALRHRLPLAAALLISPHILFAEDQDEAVA